MHQAPSEFGPIEFAWDDGQFTTLDANSDWTLELSAQPWSDPFANAPTDERHRLAAEVGLWEPAALPSDLQKVVGRTASAVEPMLNEVGELVGVRIGFSDVVVSVSVADGNVVVTVDHR